MSARVTTTKWRDNDAQVCRDRGWGPGTRLIGDEGWGPTIIEITAVGETNLLAKRIWHNGKPGVNRETNWTLSCRDWKECEPGAGEESGIVMQKCSRCNHRHRMPDPEYGSTEYLPCVVCGPMGCWVTERGF